MFFTNSQADLMTDQPFILGVNYWPQRTAMFMWREFDSATIDEDMAIINGLGLYCIRIFLLWEDFQPTPKKVPASMLDRLVQLLEVADAKNLKVVVTLFAGHIYGLTWLPPWMLLASADRNQSPVFSLGKIRFNRIRNPYAETEIMERQIYFLGELVSAVSGHPALFSWDLGNEPSQWSDSPDNFAAELWLKAMTETLKEKDDRLPITLSFHVSDLGRGEGLTPSMASKYLDYLSINGQPQRVPWAEDPFSPVFPSFLGSMTGWLGKDPVMIQEFGLATETTLPAPRGFESVSKGEQLLVSEEDAALFAEDAILHLRRSRLMGAFWKSYGDYHPSIWEWPPLDKRTIERFSGLVRHDGTPKIAASAFKSMPISSESDEISSEWLDLTHEEYYQYPDQHLRRLYGRFREYCSLA
jgi:endo-1,4-beta-mannosidase